MGVPCWAEARSLLGTFCRLVRLASHRQEECARCAGTLGMRVAQGPCDDEGRGKQRAPTDDAERREGDEEHRLTTPATLAAVWRRGQTARPRLRPGVRVETRRDTPRTAPTSAVTERHAKPTTSQGGATACLFAGTQDNQPTNRGKERRRANLSTNQRTPERRLTYQPAASFPAKALGPAGQDSSLGSTRRNLLSRLGLGRQGRRSSRKAKRSTNRRILKSRCPRPSKIFFPRTKA